MNLTELSWTEALIPVIGRATLIFATLMMSLIPLSSALAEGGQAQVRVRLLHLRLPFDVEGEGVEVKGVTLSPIKDVSIPRTENLNIKIATAAGSKVWIVKRRNQTARSSMPFIEIKSSQNSLRVGGFQVPSPILVSVKNSRQGTADVIASLDFDRYLEGVLAGEMPTSWPLEALKSQAVAARSYTLYQMKNHFKDPYQLEGSILDQAYVMSQNVVQEDKIRQAIRETEGKVLMERGQVIKAYYHSDCGGQTEDPREIWGGAGIKIKKVWGGARDSFCAFSATSKWSLEIGYGELKNKLGHDFGVLKEAKIISRTPSQRVNLIAFNDGTHNVSVTGNELRRIIGYAKLKSTLFSIAQKESALVFTGRGFGHGGGLCQFGARHMASTGATAREILSHYYPSATLSEVHVADR